MAALRILRLDTAFPRPAGDVASPLTYRLDVEISVVPQARADNVVTKDPDNFDISAFRQAVVRAEEPLVITSCGFMIYWQDILAEAAAGDFIGSSLTALPSLCRRFDPRRILVLTFDDEVLTSPLFSRHLDGFSGHVMGLDKTSHLYRVIARNLTELDTDRASRELCAQLTSVLRRHDIGLILLECTNLSVYKKDIRRIFDGEIVDMLGLVEARQPRARQAGLPVNGRVPGSDM